MRFSPFVLLAVILAWGCMPAVAAEQLAPARKVIIVYNPGTPPLKFTDEAGRAAGLLIDLWRLWAEKAGVSAEFVAAPWDDALRMVREGEADFHAGLFYTKERDRFLDFTDPLLDMEYFLFSDRTVLGVETLDDLKGFRVGVPKGFTRDFVAEHLPGEVLGTYPDFDSLYRAAHAGEVKVFVSPLINYRHFLRGHPPGDRFSHSVEHPLYTRSYRGAVREDDAALRELVNKGLNAIGPEEKAAIERQWLGSARTDTRGVLTIAGSRNLPPFTMLNEAGEPAGAGVDLWRLWSRKTGRPIQFRLTDISRSLADLKDGRADFHAGLFHSGERSEWLAFSSPYLRAPATFYYLHPGDRDLGKADFEAARIGVQGPASPTLVRRFFSKATVVGFENIAQMVAAVERGEIDGFVADRPSADLTLVKSGLRGEFKALDEDLFQAEVRVAVPKQNETLLKEIEQGLQAIGDDEIERILSRWLGDVPSYAGYLPHRDRLRLSERERRWIAEHPVLRYAVDPDFAPYEFVDEDGRHQGVSADFLELLGRKLGLTFERVQTQSWEESLRLGFGREVDVLPLINRTSGREAHLGFTRPYFVSQRVIITRAQNRNVGAQEQLADADVVLPAGYSVNEHIRGRYPRARITEVESIPTALQQVSEGAADATILSVGVAGYWMDRSEITNLRIAAAFERASTLSMAARKDWPELAAILQKGLDSVTEEERAQIRRRWISLGGETGPVVNVGLSGEEEAWLAQHPSVRVGGDANWPPMGFAGADGRFEGITADYLKLLGGRLGIEFAVATDRSWPQMLDQVRGDELDVLGAVVQTPERDSYLTFTHPYFVVPYYIYTRSDDERIAGMGDLDGLTVAVEKDFNLHERLSMDFAAVRLLVVDDTIAALQAVAFGKADAYIGNAAASGWLIEQNRITNLRAVAAADALGKSELRLGVRKDWPLLASALSKALAGISPETHRSIQRRWLTPTVEQQHSKLALTEVEKAWLEAHPQLRLGVDSDRRPLEYVTSEGDYEGIAAAFMARIGEMLGVRMHRGRERDWSHILAEVRAGKVDVLPAVGDSPARRDHLSFTKSYLHFPVMVFTRRNAQFVSGIGDLDGMRVAVEKGFVTEEYLQRDFPGLDLLKVDNTSQALRALAVGDADAYVGNLTLASYQIDKLGLGNLKVAAPTPYSDDLAIGVRRDWPVLVGILDKALAAIDEDERRSIRQRSLAIRYDMEVNYALVWKVVAGAGSLLLLALLWLAQTGRQKRALAAAKADAEQANRIKGYFLANMSHEIRTPMNAILGFAHLAMQTELDPRQRGYLEKIHVSAHSLLGVINDILDFSKIEAGRLEIEQTRFSLDDVLDNMAHVNVMHAEQKGLELLFDRDLRVPAELYGDPLRLGEVLTNLVNNAVKFTSDGEVKVSVQLESRTKDTVRVGFSVKDTGIGIEPAQIGRLFQAFAQLDGSTTRRYGGSGLGLSICYRLVELMGGELRVESKIGAGSRFYFSLRFGVHPQDDAGAWIPEPDLRGLRALVVDDNPSARQILGDMLKSFTFDVITVPDAQSAFASLRKADLDDTPFRVVLMDWRLPGIDGVEAGRRIRSELPLRYRPVVVVVTAFGREEVMHQAEQAGLGSVLVKPVSPSLLFDTVVVALGGRSRAVGSKAVKHAHRRLTGNILLVEDNLINQQLARELLELMGLTVHTAGNGQEALNALDRHDFDLVLMDIQMPEMDGYEATRRIRGQDSFQNLPVVAMTAHAMSGEREKCLTAGMNDHLPKPVDPDALFDTLSRWLDRGEPAAEVAERAGDDVDLPDQLPGIDLRRGLERVGGNRRLFHKLLVDFVSHHGDGLALLERDLGSGDLAAARREAHTLLGVAGNIGAARLHDASRVLEGALSGPKAAEVRSLPEEFKRAFTELFDGLAKLEAPGVSADPGARRSSVTKSSLPALTAQLRSMLEDGDPEAASLLNRIAQAVPGGDQDEVLARLAAQVDAYDFDLARETLDALALKFTDEADE